MKIYKSVLVMILYLIMYGCKGRSLPTDESKIISQMNISTDTNLIYFQGKILNNIFVYQTFKDSIKLKDLIKNDQEIVLYFSYSACMDCIQRAFEIINDVNENHLLKIIGLTDFQDTRTIFTIMKQYNLEFPYFSTLHNDIGFKGNIFPGPYFFVLKKSLKIERVLSSTGATKEEIISFLQNN